MLPLFTPSSSSSANIGSSFRKRLRSPAEYNRLTEYFRTIMTNDNIPQEAPAASHAEVKPHEAYIGPILHSDILFGRNSGGGVDVPQDRSSVREGMLTFLDEVYRHEWGKQILKPSPTFLVDSITLLESDAGYPRTLSDIWNLVRCGAYCQRLGENVQLSHTLQWAWLLNDLVMIVICLVRPQVMERVLRTDLATLLKAHCAQYDAVLTYFPFLSDPSTKDATGSQVPCKGKIEHKKWVDPLKRGVAAVCSRCWQQLLSIDSCKKAISKASSAVGSTIPCGLSVAAIEKKLDTYAYPSLSSFEREVAVLLCILRSLLSHQRQDNNSTITNPQKRNSKNVIDLDADSEPSQATATSSASKRVESASDVVSLLRVLDSYRELWRASLVPEAMAAFCELALGAAHMDSVSEETFRVVFSRPVYEQRVPTANSESFDSSKNVGQRRAVLVVQDLLALDVKGVFHLPFWWVDAGAVPEERTSLRAMLATAMASSLPPNSPNTQEEHSDDVQCRLWFDWLRKELEDSVDACVKFLGPTHAMSKLAFLLRTELVARSRERELL